MIRLKELLFEETAAEEAKKYGLKHIGFGRYVVPNVNKVVAKSKEGKLVWTKPNVKNSIEKGLEIKSQKKKEAEKREQRKKRPVKRTKLNVDKAEFKGIRPISVSLPKNFKASQVRTANGVLFDDFNEKNDPNELVEPIVDGEKVVFWDGYGWGLVNAGIITQTQRDAFLEANRYWRDGPDHPGQAKDDEVRNVRKNLFTAPRQGYKQGLRLFERLSPKELNNFLEMQRRWQSGPPYIVDSPVRRKKRNQYINKVLAGKDPKKDAPVTEILYPLERGMRMEPEVLREFLSQFKIGGTITLPPSGYSLDPAQARGCSQTSVTQWLQQPENIAAGVLLRLHSQGEKSALKGEEGEAGSVIGYPLVNKIKALQRYKEDHPEASKIEAAKNFITSWYDEFPEEAEVIRPGFAAQKVQQITKHVFPVRNEETGKVIAARILYVIDMVEQGPVDDPKQIAEQKQVVKPIKRFYKYLNTTVARNRILKKLKRISKK